MIQFPDGPRVTTQQLKELLQDRFSGECPTSLVSILTSEDGDYFLRLCTEEGGGIAPSVESLFRSKPVGKRLSFASLLDLLDQVQACPRFQSLNGAIVLGYTIHIWIGDEYVVHAPGKLLAQARRMNLIDRLFHPVATNLIA